MFEPKEVAYGKKVRRSFSRIKEVLDVPNLISVQKNSYQLFLDEGLREIFRDVSPITDYTGNLVLEFFDYSLDEKPKYTVEECKERDATYSAPLKVKARLVNKETGEIKEQEIFMGEFPLMTETGTFIVNGAERVIVSQLVRSPGVYYDVDLDRSGDKVFSATVIPYRGAWLEYETDANGILHVRIDRTRKLHLTILLRALGYGTDYEITELLGDDKRLLDTLAKDNIKTQDEALIEIYKRLRPGEPATVEGATTLLKSLFFDPKRYDLAKFGRFKFNKKLSIAARIWGNTAAEDIVSPITGEVLAQAGEVISREKADQIQDNAINRVLVMKNEKPVAIIGNNTVDIKAFVNYDISDLKIVERVHWPVLEQILAIEDKDEQKKTIEDNIDLLVPRVVTIEDMLASVNYLIHLGYDIGKEDDIDHLGNRRLRSVGELLQNQFRIGLARLERTVRERMTVQDLDIVTPQALINIRPIVAAIKEFFGSSQLSQFMDQTNPLAELTHKRRLSALGPGGLNRDRASFEVRDVHYSHYSRMCPIETPEGPNIGLIGYLSSYARINPYGFIEVPYRRINKDGTISDEIDYLTADEEEKYMIAQATEKIGDDGKFVSTKLEIREKEDIRIVEREKVDYMDVSPKQLVSVATAMIPFLENDDASRALMGSNMQRQAVPLIKTQAPIVGTGMEYKAACDSGVVVLAKNEGVIDKLYADRIVVRTKTGSDEYKLTKYKRSNQGTCINQKPIVKIGDKVKKGDVLADGPSTDGGEIALGRNILIGFMTWEGYNYEDAILISEKLVREDVFTSIHIEEYECEARDTKIGPEEITRQITQIGETPLKDLDENGIIRLGAEVRSGDILVGKTTPKGETELSAEERLLRAIFGKDERDRRDTSLRLPHGESGIVVDIKVFTREQGDELMPGVNQLVRVYVAQKRKVSVGDKMAGRHGNKGVISRILPEEDMPFLPDGTPLEIVLNPLGVPSRMNIGQVLEVHLGYAARALGWEIATPVFDGATESDIVQTLKTANLPEDGKITLYDGRTGMPFDNKVTVGYMYILKLAHLVDDKIHARSTGPYSLVTQQPLGGKAQFGGQRFGEMEVWALEAYGASYTLQEILTVKSDDVVGRVKTYEAIVKGENVPEPGIPESFKVLIKELQSLALDVKVFSEERDEIKIKDYSEDYIDDLSMVIDNIDKDMISGGDDDIVDGPGMGDLLGIGSGGKAAGKKPKAAKSDDDDEDDDAVEEEDLVESDEEALSDDIDFDVDDFEKVKPDEILEDLGDDGFAPDLINDDDLEDLGSIILDELREDGEEEETPKPVKRPKSRAKSKIGDDIESDSLEEINKAYDEPAKSKPTDDKNKRGE